MCSLTPISDMNRRGHLHQSGSDLHQCSFGVHIAHPFSKGVGIFSLIACSRWIVKYLPQHFGTMIFLNQLLCMHDYCLINRNTLTADPPTMDPLQHGFEVKPGSVSIVPTIVAAGVPLVPEDLLKLIRCSCSSLTRACKGACGCKLSGMVCTQFCACKGGDMCHNVRP